MSSCIASALSLRFPPLALFYAQAAPADSEIPNPLCSMLLVAQAAKGQTVAITMGSCGCSGAGEGFGLGSFSPDNFPGGRECFLRFLSIGNGDWEQGRAVAKQLADGGAPEIMLQEFTEGEGFLKTPELVAQWLEEVPRIEPEARYVVIKPLEALAPGETARVVTLLVDPDQLSALLVLANFARPGVDFSEATQAKPRAVVGLTDISARFAREAIYHQSSGRSAQG